MPLPLGLGVGFGLLAAVGLGFDLSVPESVDWEAASISGIAVERAGGLVVQDRRGDVIWATIGFTIYRSEGNGPFEKLETLRPKPSEAWAGYSATFRHLFRYQELVELLAISNTELIAFAGGEAFRVDVSNGAAERVHELRYFGRGIGRGLMPHGLTVDDAGTLYYGEYPTRKMGADDTVRIYRSADQGRSWEIAHEFAGNFVRHIHAVQWDPHGRALWVATGDTDAESRIGYSEDRGESFTWIGSGDQQFRAVSLLFLEESVTWAMDSPVVESRIVRWRRATGVVETSEQALPSPGYYARAIDGKSGLVTLAERDAAVLLISGSSFQTLFRWQVEPDPERPHPAVRLLRSSTPSDPRTLLINPLRTERESAAVYRLRVADAL